MMVTNKKILEKVDHNYYEWSLGQKNVLAIFQDVFKRFESLDKQIKDLDNKIEELAMKVNGTYSSGVAFPRNTERRPWTKDEDGVLLFLKQMGRSYDYMAKQLGRTPNAVQTRWHKCVKPVLQKTSK